MDACRRDAWAGGRRAAVGLGHEAPHRACRPRRARGGHARPRRAGRAAGSTRSPSPGPRLRAAGSTARSRSPSRAVAASTRTRASSSPPACRARPAMPFADYFAQRGRRAARPRRPPRRLAGPRLPRSARRPAGARPRASRSRRSSRPRPSPRRPTVQFPGLDGVLPGLGRMEPNDWGLAFELRDAKSPHWTGSRNSRATFGHFGASGTFLWVDPDASVACGVLTDRPFGDWAKEAWPGFSDSSRRRRVAAGARRTSPGRSSRPLRESSRTRSPFAARSSPARPRRSSRRAGARYVRRDRAGVTSQAGEDDVEAVARLALATRTVAGRTSSRSIRFPSSGERLARQPGEQLDPGELVLCRRAARRGLLHNTSKVALRAHPGRRGPEVEPNGPLSLFPLRFDHAPDERSRLPSHRGRHRRDVARGLGGAGLARSRRISASTPTSCASSRAASTGPATD